MNRPSIHQYIILYRQRLAARLAILPILTLLLSVTHLAGQENRLLVMTWNLLNFPDHSTERLASMGLVIGEIKPDILVVNEMKIGGTSLLYSQVLQPLTPTYLPGPFVANDDLNNAIFFDSERLSLLGSVTIETALRDINGYTFRIEDHADTAFAFTIFAAHLKAGNPYYDPTDATKRWEECKRLQAYIANRDSSYHYAFAGDFNFYSSTEDGYSLLMNSMSIDLEDPIDSPGGWHDGETFSHIHTQSTRSVKLADGGADGGMDDRFDFILLSHHMFRDSAALSYVTGSYQAYGNDGLHFDKSINDGNNAMVPAAIANALYTASDHLPVLLELVYPADPTHAIRGDIAGNNIPATYRLHPNYPNPFNAITTIRYDLPVASHVRLIVYDLSGREITLLEDGWRQAGSHSYSWNTQTTGNPDLSSGLYVVRLITPEYSTSGKLILQK